MRRRAAPRSGATLLLLLLPPPPPAAAPGLAPANHTVPDGRMCAAAAGATDNATVLAEQMVDGVGQCCDVCAARGDCAAAVLLPGPYAGQEYYRCVMKGADGAVAPDGNATLISFSAGGGEGGEPDDDTVPPSRAPANRTVPQEEDAPAGDTDVWVAVVGAAGGVAAAAAAAKVVHTYACAPAGAASGGEEDLALQRMARVCQCPLAPTAQRLTVAPADDPRARQSPPTRPHGGSRGSEQRGVGGAGRSCSSTEELRNMVAAGAPLLDDGAASAASSPPRDDGGDECAGGAAAPGFVVWVHRHLSNAEKKAVAERAEASLGPSSPAIELRQLPSEWTHDPYQSEQAAAVSEAVLRACGSPLVAPSDGAGAVLDGVQITGDEYFFHFRAGIRLARRQKILLLERYRQKVPRRLRGKMVTLVDDALKEEQHAGTRAV